MLNFEVTERKKDSEFTLWVSFIFFFFFSLRNSTFFVQYSIFNILFTMTKVGTHSRFECVFFGADTVINLCYHQLQTELRRKT